MDIAVGLPQIGGDVRSAVRAAQEAEDAGAWGVWVFDNLAPIVGPHRPVLDGWALLGPLARATSRVQLVSLVTRAGLRPPALVARMAACIQDASAGRFVLGLGAGDSASRAEESRFGVDAPASRSARLELIRETIAEVRGSGPAPLGPDVAAPPVWVGGMAPEIVRLAAGEADAWHGWGCQPDAFAGAARRTGGQAWWGGIFDPRTAEEETAAFREAGAAGITWMIRSTREPSDRQALMGLLR